MSELISEADARAARPLDDVITAALAAAADAVNAAGRALEVVAEARAIVARHAENQPDAPLADWERALVAEPFDPDAPALAVPDGFVPGGNDDDDDDEPPPVDREDRWVGTGEPVVEAPPAPRIEGAMPPDHCANHRDFSDHCRACGLAYEAQQRWKSDRDAVARRARAEVAEEIRQETEARAAAVAACGTCGDDGRLPSGVVCTHTPPQVAPPRSGREEFRAAKKALDDRLEAKKGGGEAKEAGPRMSTGNQLGALTFAEAGYVLDRLSAPQPSADGPTVDAGPERSTEPPDGALDGTSPPVDDDAEDDSPGQGWSDPADGDDDEVPPVGGFPDDFDDEYRRDQESWRDYEGGHPAAYAATGGTDEPIF